MRFGEAGARNPRLGIWTLFGAGALAGCQHPAAPPPSTHLHYQVGTAYQTDGVWHYPRQDFAYRETGLAVVDPPEKTPRLTADGELYNPLAMAGAHPSLQLPVEVTVRNLENGRQVELRLNDRGPAHRGRLLSLTPQAANALGVQGGGPIQVEIVEVEAPSRGFAETLPGGPLLDMQAAPVGTVEQVTLDSSGKAIGSVEPAASLPARTAAASPASPPTSLPVLPVAATQSFAQPGVLWIEAGRFTDRRYAAMQAARCGGTVWYTPSSHEPPWQVRIGPFPHVNEADAALDRALSAGLTGAHIVVE